MKSIFLLASLMLLSGCNIISYTKPIPIDEINSLHSNAIKHLELKVSTQTDNLRIDIIRQTETEEDSDGDCETVDVPYHPLGFDLGNGLFFDFNNNLSFRIDSLLSLKGNEDFELVKKIYRVQSKISRTDNQTCISRIGFNGKNRENCLGIMEYKSNGMRYFSRQKLVYELTQNEKMNKVSFEPRFGRSIDIFSEGENNFVFRQRKFERRFFLDKNQINLRNKYLVERNSFENTLDIYLLTRKSQYLLYKIKIDKQKMIVYNKNNYGMVINYSPTKISIKNNDDVNANLSFERVK